MAAKKYATDSNTHTHTYAELGVKNVAESEKNAEPKPVPESEPEHNVGHGGICERAYSNSADVPPPLITPPTTALALQLYKVFICLYDACHAENL